MRCPRCHSDNVTVSVVSEQKLKKKATVACGGYLLGGG